MILHFCVATVILAGPTVVPADEASAKSAATRFAQALGLDIGSSVRVRPAKLTFGAAGWGVYGNNLAFDVEAQSNAVLSFRDLGSDEDAWPPERRTGQTYFVDEKHLVNRAQQVVASIGVTREIIPYKVVLRKDRVPYNGILDVGFGSVLFVQVERGYPYLFGRNKVQVDFDYQNGVITHIEQFWPYKAVSFTKNLSEEQAKQKAVAYYKQYFKVDSPPPITKVEVGYLTPNGMFGVPDHLRKPPFEARLGYAVTFRDKDYIGVDAGDGRFLGGFPWDLPKP